MLHDVDHAAVTPGADITPPKIKRAQLFEDAYEAMIFNNSFPPDSVINYKMKDNRELKYCHTCKTYKLPRMHHCS